MFTNQLDLCNTLTTLDSSDVIDQISSRGQSLAKD